MTRGLSSTILPAPKVKKACWLALAQLKDERAVAQSLVERDWIRQYQIAHPVRSRFQTPSTILYIMPEHMKLVYDQYRKNDENTLSALAALCAAAEDANDKFTIHMTADDFRLVARFYNNEEIHDGQQLAASDRVMALGGLLDGASRDVGRVDQKRADVG